MTRCVVVLGLLCVEMCLVWSWFGLLIWKFNFSFELARRCYCCLLRWSACLFILSFFWNFYFCNVEFLHKCSEHKPSPLPSHPQSLYPTLAHTHNNKHAQNLTSPPMTPSLCFAIGVPPQLLTDFLVFLQSRKASEQAKSVESKTDSIGSGRAIPIKQVSSLPHFFTLHLSQLPV